MHWIVAMLPSVAAYKAYGRGWVYKCIDKRKMPYPTAEPLFRSVVTQACQRNAIHFLPVVLRLRRNHLTYETRRWHCVGVLLYHGAHQPMAVKYSYPETRGFAGSKPYNDYWFKTERWERQGWRMPFRGAIDRNPII